MFNQGLSHLFQWQLAVLVDSEMGEKAQTTPPMFYEQFQEALVVIFRWILFLH